MDDSARNERSEGDRTNSRRGRASCRHPGSYLCGIDAKTYLAPPQTCRQIAARVNLPLTRAEVRETARRGYIDEATAEEIVERGGLW